MIAAMLARERFSARKLPQFAGHDNSAASRTATSIYTEMRTLGQVAGCCEYWPGPIRQ
jgi:hypothetical protein